MALKLYELMGDDDRRFSPYCWRIRMALAHKELEAEIVPCRFTDKELFAFSGQDRLPVLQDGETAIADSWDIACYLPRPVEPVRRRRRARRRPTRARHSGLVWRLGAARNIRVAGWRGAHRSNTSMGSRSGPEPIPREWKFL